MLQIKSLLFIDYPFKMNKPQDFIFINAGLVGWLSSFSFICSSRSNIWSVGLVGCRKMMSASKQPQDDSVKQIYTLVYTNLISM